VQEVKRLVYIIIVIIIAAGGYGLYRFRFAPVAKLTDANAAHHKISGKPADANARTAIVKTVTDANRAGHRDVNDANIAKLIKEGKLDPNAIARLKRQGKMVKDANEPNKPADPNDQPVAVNLNNVDMASIISILTDWTGKSIIPSDQAMQVRLTVYAPKKITRRQALGLIYSALRIKGFVPEQIGSTIYIKPLREAKLGSVMTVGPDEDLSKVIDGGQMIEKIFKLKNSSAGRMQEMVGPLVADYGQVTADDSTNSLIIIDTLENLKRVERLIKELDTPDSDQMATQIFEIKHGDPVEIAQLVRTLVGDGKSRSRNRSGAGQGAPTQPQPPQGPGSSPGGPLQTARVITVGQNQTPIVLIPELRRKWIIARASAEDMEQISRWIEKLDKESAAQSAYDIVQIAYADPQELSQKLMSTLQRLPGSEDRSNITVEPLTQSRQLIIFGSPDKRDLVKHLIQEIDVPTSSLFLTEEFTLKYADPEQIEQNINDLYDINKGMASWSWRRKDYSSPDAVRVISYSTLKKITVIASPQNMGKIRDQIKSWDVAIDVNDVKPMILELHNSDPVKMADLLSGMFSNSKSSSGRNNDFFDFFFWPPNNNESKPSVVGPLFGKLSFQPVPETKKIIVTSKVAQAYDVVKALVAELDKHEAAELPAVITLKYADAEDLAEQLNATLNETGTISMVKRNHRGLSEQKVDSSTGMRISSVGQDQTATDYSQNNMLIPWWDRARKDDKEMPISNVMGKIRFIPVYRSKSLLVVAPPEYIDDIRKMVEDLDKPGKQVMIKAIILEVDHDSFTTLGAQLSTNPAAFGPVGENAAAALSNLSYTQKSGSFSITSTTSITAIVDLLIKKANGRVLNQPTLWTKDNEEAEFFKGRSIAFIQNAVTSQETTATNSFFKYQPVGVTLRTRPNITPERAVDLTVNLIISQVDPQLVNGQIATDELNTTTNSIIGDGKTILIGGILFQEDTTIVRKTPLLGDLPLLGPLFRHYDVTKSNDELLAFLTPYVIDENARVESRREAEEPVDKLNQEGGELKKSVEKAGRD
jgi:general secretion pathway protein D